MGSVLSVSAHRDPSLSLPCVSVSCTCWRSPSPLPTSRTSSRWLRGRQCLCLLGTSRRLSRLRRGNQSCYFPPNFGGVTTSYAFLPASSTRGSPSSTPGSPEYPKIRACLVAFMLANTATQDFHSGPAAEVESHLILGL